MNSLLLLYFIFLVIYFFIFFFFFSSRRRHTRSLCDWSSDVCSSDLTPVPHRLEDTIRQAKNKDVLYCFLTKIMIDAVDLFFFKNPGNLAVEVVRRCQGMSKGSFNDDARPALAISIQAHCAKTLDDIRIFAGQRRNIR